MTLFYFPQWQGAGDSRRYPLLPCAELLRQHICNDNPQLEAGLCDISLEDDLSLELEQGIIGRRVLLRQFEHAVDVVARHDPERLGLIGGDCAIELAPVSHLHRRYGESLALLWVDAHADLNLPETSPSQALHGMPLRMLLGEGDSDFVSGLHPLNIEQVYLVGVRDVDPPEKDTIEQHNLALFPPVEMGIDIDGICALLQERKQRHVYFHLDLDALDPTVFSQVGFPAAGGLSVAAVAELLQVLQEQFELVGFSMTECLSTDGAGLNVLDPLLDMLAKFAM